MPCGVNKLEKERKFQINNLLCNISNNLHSRINFKFAQWKIQSIQHQIISLVFLKCVAQDAEKVKCLKMPIRIENFL